MFKFFKKKKEIKRYNFIATIELNNFFDKVEIQGFYPNSIEFAQDLDILMGAKTFFANQPNGDSIVIRTEDIRAIIVAGKPVGEDSND